MIESTNIIVGNALFIGGICGSVFVIRIVMLLITRIIHDIRDFG
jgi:hypothetical protein